MALKPSLRFSCICKVSILVLFKPSTKTWQIDTCLTKFFPETLTVTFWAPWLLQKWKEGSQMSRGYYKLWSFSVGYCHRPIHSKCWRAWVWTPIGHIWCFDGRVEPTPVFHPRDQGSTPASEPQRHAPSLMQGNISHREILEKIECVIST